MSAKIRFLIILTFIQNTPCFGMDLSNTDNNLKKRGRPETFQHYHNKNSPYLKKIKSAPAEVIEIDIEMDEKSADSINEVPEGDLLNFDFQNDTTLAERQYAHAQELEKADCPDRHKIISYYERAAECGHIEAIKRNHCDAIRIINTVGEEDHLSALPFDLIYLIFQYSVKIKGSPRHISKAFRTEFTKILPGFNRPTQTANVFSPDIDYFVSFINSLPNIKNLNLKIQNNSLKNENSAPTNIDVILKKITTLRSITFHQNSIDSSSAQNIATALRNNKTLILLKIPVNTLGCLPTIKMAQSLKYNATLTELNLAGNNIRDYSAKFLWEALKQNTTLKILNLNFNYIGKTHKYEHNLPEMLLTNTSLTGLKLRGNNFNHHSILPLAETLKRIPLSGILI